MSSTEYTSNRQYILDMVNMTSRFMIVPRLDKVLAKEKQLLLAGVGDRYQSYNSVAVKKGQGSRN